MKFLNHRIKDMDLNHKNAWNTFLLGEKIWYIFFFEILKSRCRIKKRNTRFCFIYHSWFEFPLPHFKILMHLFHILRLTFLDFYYFFSDPKRIALSVFFINISNDIYFKSTVISHVICGINMDGVGSCHIFSVNSNVVACAMGLEKYSL